MAPSYIAAVALILSELLKLAGVQIGTEELTQALVTVVQLVAGLVIAYRQIVEGRSTLMGARPRTFRGK